MAITAQEAEGLELDIELVQNADNMNRRIFCLHMTHRHSDSLGGMSELNPAVQNDYTEELWRTFHDRLHKVKMRSELDHEHEQNFE
jgi:phosphoribosyl 1,2-cyclic phosphodiesterase